MADVISVTNSDSAFDASKGVTRTNLPPFAQRLRKAADLVWEEGYRQPFIRELGEGTLPREKFAFYLLQDFRYLNDYARVHALGLAKTDDPEIMAFMLNVQNGALNVESTVHRTYLASYGITDEQMNNVRQSAFARAYTSNILSIAYGKDILDILVAVLPCAGCMRITDTVSPTNSPTRSTRIRIRAGWICTRRTSSGRVRLGCSSISRSSSPMRARSANANWSTSS